MMSIFTHAIIFGTGINVIAEGNFTTNSKIGSIGGAKQWVKLGGFGEATVVDTASSIEDTIFSVDPQPLDENALKRQAAQFDKYTKRYPYYARVSQSS